MAAFALAACSDDEGVIPAHPARDSNVQSVSSPANGGSARFTLPTEYSCTNILIEASRDGGVWWFPQSGGFDAAADHQGKKFADLLRQQGYRVDEMPRNVVITDDVLKNYAVIIRTDGTHYSAAEIQSYHKKLNDGVTLLLLADHHKFERTDQLAESLDIKFSGVVEGRISTSDSNPFTNNVGNLNYMVGSAISNSQQNSNIIPIGWLVDGAVVMAKYKHDHSEIFLMGDVNTLEFFPQPFVDNLSAWITSDCSNR
jgi:hypothetical protein